MACLPHAGFEVALTYREGRSGPVAKCLCFRESRGRTPPGHLNRPRPDDARYCLTGTIVLPAADRLNTYANLTAALDALERSYLSQVPSPSVSISTADGSDTAAYWSSAPHLAHDI